MRYHVPQSGHVESFTQIAGALRVGRESYASCKTVAKHDQNEFFHHYEAQITCAGRYPRYFPAHFPRCSTRVAGSNLCIWVCEYDASTVRGRNTTWDLPTFHTTYPRIDAE